MRPENRLETALELAASLARPGHRPAGDLIQAYFRSRRYAGSHDRRWIAEAVYACLRHRTRLLWRAAAWWTTAGMNPGAGLNPRQHDLPLFLLLAREGRLGDAPEAVFAAALRLVGDRPGAAAALRQLWRTPEPPPDPGTRRPQDMAITLSLPAWAVGRLEEVYGLRGMRLIGEAMLETAPVDLRANTLKTDRVALASRLEREAGIPAEPVPWSPWGLRIEDRVPLQGLRVFRDGWFEVQDEGSQLVGLATAASAGEMVIDACAGGGGKTLALAAMMNNRGRILATDPDERRLAAVRRRCRRAGVTNTGFLRLPPGGCLPRASLGKADCVLVDAPCSGSGTWRRYPDLKGRYGDADLQRMRHNQQAILERFAPAVRREGRLVYATCSLFEEENEAVIDAFLKGNPGWTLCAPEPLRRTTGADAWFREGSVRLDPVRSGTDGFFIACMIRGG